MVFKKYSLIHIIHDSSSFFTKYLTERVTDDLNRTVFLKTNNSLAKLTNSISSVSSFWQIRWKMTLDLRLVTNQFSLKYSLIPWTCEIFRTFYGSELKEYLSMKYMRSWVKAVKILVGLQKHWIELKSQGFTIYSLIHITSDRFCVSGSVNIFSKMTAGHWYREKYCDESKILIQNESRVIWIRLYFVLRLYTWPIGPSVDPQKEKR